MTRRLLEAAAPLVVLLDLLSPWLLGYSHDPPAVAGHVAFAMAFLPIGLLAGTLPAAAAVLASGGLWLAASPFVLGYAGLGASAWLPDLVAGIALLGLGAALAVQPAESSGPI